MEIAFTDPELTFAALAARLQAQGWLRADDPTAPSPLIAGEPETVQFVRNGARLQYDFAPATGLRTLRIAGPGGAAALAALHALGQWKAEHPDRSMLFLLVGSTHNRLQVLRWLAHDRQGSNADIEAVLRTALADPDWEVRVTALVVAARLRAAPLLQDVARTVLPADMADGVNGDEQRMLRTILLCAVELLQGGPVPPASDAPPHTRERMHGHLLRCLAGAPVGHHDQAFLLLASLFAPLPDDAPAPVVLPPGIVATDDGYMLAANGMALCWVPPVPHWLGAALPRMPCANPIRSQTGPGFFMACTPAARVGYDAALSSCSALGAETGLTIRLPSADEWEMAARGPDGRRFPWGNNARAEACLGPSPWGVVNAVGVVPQWTSSVQDGAILVCGGKKQWVCALRERVHRDALCAVRCVVAL
jgi:hypothetical protein